MRAAVDNDADALPAAIEALQDEAHPGVDCTNPGWRTPLVIFAEHGNLSAVERLLAAGARVDGYGGYGTPMSRAIDRGHSEVAACLLAAGADPLSDDGYGKTPLVLACMRGDLQTVRAILRSGIDADAEKREVYPLWAAAEHGQPRAMRLLLQKGADPRRIVDGNSLMNRVCKWGVIEAVRVLLRAGVDPDHTGPGRATGLAKAAARGRIQIMGALLKAGADVDAVAYRTTPLMYAANKNRPEAVRLLLQHGASPSVRDDRGRTAMMIATGLNYFGCVSELQSTVAVERRVRRRR